MNNTETWKNYGDVNFVDYGGCMIKPHWSKQEIDNHPDLASVYDVFYVNTEIPEMGEGIIAALLTVDIHDSWLVKSVPDVLYAIGEEKRKDKPMDEIMPGDMWAKEFVDFFSFESFSPTYYHDGMLYPAHIITTEQLRSWMKDLGMSEYLDVPELTQNMDLLVSEYFERYHRDLWNRIALSYRAECYLSHYSEDWRYWKRQEYAVNMMIKEKLVKDKKYFCDCFACEAATILSKNKPGVCRSKKVSVPRIPRICKLCPFFSESSPEMWNRSLGVCVINDSAYQKLSTIKNGDFSIISLCEEVRDFEINENVFLEEK